MRHEDALRKVRLLRDYNIDRGAFAAEAENAATLARLLMERYGIAKEQADLNQERGANPAVWDYWDHLLNQFSLELRHFGRRGNASLGSGQTIVIQLDASEWHVQKPSPTGWMIVAQGKGPQSLRNFLAANLPRTYSMFRPS